MRLHLVALPHVRLGTDTTHLCAYSGKVMKFCKMMAPRHEILLYAPESDFISGVETVQCLSENARIATFGADDPNRLPEWPNDRQSLIFNMAAATKIIERAGDRDLVLLTGGLTHLPIKSMIPHLMCIEPGVGYEGVIGGDSYAAYESYFHMAQIYAKMKFTDIRWFDRVIQPYVDADEFPLLNDGKGDYLLFVGRLIARKGAHIAAQIAKAAGMQLVVAGSGGRMEGGKLIGTEGVELEGDIYYEGPVGIQARAKLMAGAKALLMPTTYGEPGGNVAIEAMMAGTPVIAPDWGVMAETIVDGCGFHFRTLKQAVDSVNCLGKGHLYTPESIHATTRDRFGLDAIGAKFDDWFTDLQSLWDPAGWAKL